MESVYFSCMTMGEGGIVSVGPKGVVMFQMWDRSRASAFVSGFNDGGGGLAMGEGNQTTTTTTTTIGDGVATN